MGDIEIAALWRFLPVGYALTVAIELPILLVALSPQHSWPRRLAAGFWLTAVTYPMVVLVLPVLMAQYSRVAYLAVAETFAPAAECALFWWAFGGGEPGGWRWRDFAAIVAANLASFAMGEWLHRYAAI